MPVLHVASVRSSWDAGKVSTVLGFVGRGDAIQQHGVQDGLDHGRHRLRVDIVIEVATLLGPRKQFVETIGEPRVEPPNQRGLGLADSLRPRTAVRHPRMLIGRRQRLALWCAVLLFCWRHCLPAVQRGGGSHCQRLIEGSLDLTRGAFRHAPLRATERRPSAGPRPAGTGRNPRAPPARASGCARDQAARSVVVRFLRLHALRHPLRLDG